MANSVTGAAIMPVNTFNACKEEIKNTTDNTSRKIYVSVITPIGVIMSVPVGFIHGAKEGLYADAHYLKFDKYPDGYSAAEFGMYMKP